MKKTRRLLSLIMVAATLVAVCVAGTVNTYAAEEIVLANGFIISAEAGVPLSSVNGTAYGYVGDSDLDGKMTVRDATNIQKFVARMVKFTDNSRFLADVNMDGAINIKDATAIQKYIAKISIKDMVNHVVYAPKNNFTINNIHYNPYNNYITEGRITLNICKLYWLGGRLYVEAYVINGTDKPVYDLSLSYLSISNANGNMANGYFSDVVIKELPAKGTSVVKVNFTPECITNYGADLSSFIYTYI